MTDERWDRLDALADTFTERGWRHWELHGTNFDNARTIPIATIRDLVAAARRGEEALKRLASSPVSPGPTPGLREAASEAAKYLDTLNFYGLTPAPYARLLAERLRAALAASPAPEPIGLLRERDALRAALLMYGHEYDVDGRQEWHSFNCTYRKTWAMGGDDERPCIAARAALHREDGTSLSPETIAADRALDAWTEDIEDSRRG